VRFILRLLVALLVVVVVVVALLLLVTKSRIADLFSFHFWYNMRGEVGLTD
jgi:hypothetical protein